MYTIVSSNLCSQLDVAIGGGEEAFFAVRKVLVWVWGRRPLGDLKKEGGRLQRSLGSSR